MNHVAKVRSAVAIALSCLGALATPTAAQVEVLDGVTGRLRTLPFRTFRPDADSFLQFLFEDTWQCRSGSIVCAWSDDRPTNASYSLVPVSLPSADPIWPDGSALHGSSDSIRCSRDASSDVSDIVLDSDTPGTIVTPPPYGDARFLGAIANGKEVRR